MHRSDDAGGVLREAIIVRSVYGLLTRRPASLQGRLKRPVAQIVALNDRALVRGYNRPLMRRATTSPPRPPRRQIRSTVLALIAVCLLGAGCGPPTRVVQGLDRPNVSVIQGPDRPNVILILTDDLDVQLLEEHMEDYPNLRELAAEGTTFENAFVTDPLCCPSRATILRGQYAHNHEIVGNSWPR